MSVQIVKVMEKPEWPKFYVSATTGARVRCFSKSDIPRKGYLLEADYQAAVDEVRQEEARAAAMETLRANIKAKKV